MRAGVVVPATSREINSGAGASIGVRQLENLSWRQDMFKTVDEQDHIKLADIGLRIFCSVNECEIVCIRKISRRQLSCAVDLGTVGVKPATAAAEATTDFQYSLIAQVEIRQLRKEYGARFKLPKKIVGRRLPAFFRPPRL